MLATMSYFVALTPWAKTRGSKRLMKAIIPFVFNRYYLIGGVALGFLGNKWEQIQAENDRFFLLKVVLSY